MKRPYLVVYDYGHGGVWAILSARSTSEIMRKFPELQVVEQPPSWMSESRMDELRLSMTFDIDEPRGLLASLLADRNEGREGPSASHV